MSEIKIEVRYYNSAQQVLFQGYPNATQLNLITQNHLSVSKDEFLSYMMFTEQDDSHSEYKTFSDLRDKVQHRFGDINNYLTLNNGSVQSNVTAQQMMAAGFTERLGVALGLTVVNKIHALTEADWKKIPESKGRGIKIKTFDFELPVASTGSNFIQAENKGAILTNNNDQTGSVTTHYSGKHGILSKKTFVRSEEIKSGVSLHQNLYYGTIGVLGTNPNSIARVWLVDPPAIDIQMEPAKYKLLARLSYYLDEFRAIGVREKLLDSLERRIQEISNSSDYLEFDNVPLEGAASGTIRKYMASDAFSVIDTDEAYGKAFVVFERDSPFVYIVAFAKTIIRDVIKQNFRAIINFNYNPDFLRGNVSALVRLDEKFIPETRFPNLKFVLSERRKLTTYEAMYYGPLNHTSSGRVFGLLDGENKINFDQNKNLDQGKK